MYRSHGERFADACVVEPDRFGGDSVMVWGGIARGIKSQLIIVACNMTAVRYRDEILRPVAVPLVQQRNLILQQDNARPHVARVCQDFLANNNIAPLAWPPYSPDLTPIEHMWDELDRRVRKRHMKLWWKTVSRGKKNMCLLNCKFSAGLTSLHSTVDFPLVRTGKK